MSKMIQIRHVSDALHRKLRTRAALAGMSMSDFLKAELARLAEQPSYEEMRIRLASRPPIAVSEAPVDTVRRERDRR